MRDKLGLIAAIGVGSGVGVGGDGAEADGDDALVVDLVILLA